MVTFREAVELLGMCSSCRTCVDVRLCFVSFFWLLFYAGREISLLIASEFILQLLTA